MRFRAFSLAVVSALLAQVAAAAPGYHCEMKWNLLLEGKSVKTFTLEKKAEADPFPGFHVKIVDDRQTSKVTIVETAASDKTNRITYELKCSRAQNCKGARIEYVKEKVKRKEFSMLPLPATVARLGGRDVFVYRPQSNGFSYRFIQYDLPSGEPAGMELSCHE